MSEVRVNYLNWNPDLEDEANKGLTVADNVVHEPEGYKPIHLASAGSFSTTGSLAASVGTILSCVAKPVGSAGDLLVAWVSGVTLHVGLNGVTATTAVTGYPLTFSTLGSAGSSITAFDVCEYANKIFFVVEATQGTSSPSTLTSIGFNGYMDY